MLGLLVLLLISWGLLYLFERKDIRALGIVPSRKHLMQFSIGFGLLTVCCLALVLIETYVKGVQWEFQGVSLKTYVSAFWYHLKSALTEDLVFRGAILYILIRRLGPKWAILLSALCFGVYHVFSYGITEERWILIFYVVLITGCTGYVWAYAFHKTKSIYLGLGFHVGYNMIMSCFYESQPFGELLFSMQSSNELLEPYQSLYSFFRGLFPTTLTLMGLILLLRIPLFRPKPKEA